MYVHYFDRCRKAVFLLLLLFGTMAGFTQSSGNQQALDEFQEFSTDSAVTSLSANNSPVAISPTESTGHEEHGRMRWTIAILTATIAAGIMVRFKTMRQLRPLVLLSSVVILGFFAGACPCIIESFQKTILLVSGAKVGWHSLLYFVAILPITYFFGRVYCGWICHLGAMQELMHRVSGRKFFQTTRAQTVMRRIRLVVLGALIVQLAITQTNLYRQIDPFRVIYNFYSTYAVGWWLVGLLVVSSLLLYRPFCKTLCPVGLVMGWISRLPGASVINIGSDCINCKKCNQECGIRAITRDDKVARINNEECIRCGNCLGSCPKGSLKIGA